MPEHKDKGAASVQKPKRIRKPPEYVAFEKMLKIVMKAPPLKRVKSGK